MDTNRRQRGDSTDHVIEYVRRLIASGDLRPGDRLPPERDLATQLGVSRPTVRAGLRALSAMGVIESKHGSGTYIPSGPPRLDSEALRFLAALHGITRDEMYEARRVLEVSVAGMAAERAASDHLATIADEVTSLFAAMNDPQVFLVHDIRFHRAVAVASGNPILASLVEMVSALYYERRRETAARATERNLHDAAELHRRIYQAIRSHNVEQAKLLMSEHLQHSSAFQEQEEYAGSSADMAQAAGTPGASAKAAATPDSN